MLVRRCAQWALAVFVLAPTAALSQDQPQWYAVEMVLFDQRAAIPDDDERWPVQPPLPAFDHPLVPVGQAQDIVGFDTLANNARDLNGIRRKLANTNGYRVLAHVGWRQPGLARDKAPAVALPLDWRPPRSVRAPTNPDEPWDLSERLDSEGEPGNPFADVPAGTRLFGSLRAYRERYLHIQLDLRFAPDGWERRSVSPDGKGERGGDRGLDRTTNKPSTYVIQQRRRLRSGEIHYIDHPIVGVIAKLKPVDTPGNAEAPPREAMPDEEDAAP